MAAVPTVFSEIREASRRVTERARFVGIDATRLSTLARELGGLALEPPEWDREHHYFGPPDVTLAFVLTLDAINFGSGWFPILRKRPGCSGYLTLATGLKERFESEGPWSAAELSGLRAVDCAAVFGQTPGGVDPGVDELMSLFATSLRALGALVVSRFDGSFEALVEAADRRAASLVGILSEMPLYRDVARYDDFDVPLYKRAQITAMDLSVALGNSGLGFFRDLDDLTIFADNLVPHVLRFEGVLCYDAQLLNRIDAGDRLAPGSQEEVEIRAVAVHAVERMAQVIRDDGGHATAGRLDQLLWSRGQRPDIKAHRRHRCRTPYY